MEDSWIPEHLTEEFINVNRKVNKVIDSCRTLIHFQIAQRYIFLAEMKYMDNSFIIDWSNEKLDRLYDKAQKERIRLH